MRALPLVALVLACARPHAPAGPGKGKEIPLDVPGEWIDPAAGLARRAREPSARARPTPDPVVIRHGTVLTAAGQRIEDGTVVLVGGRVEAVGGPGTAAPAGARELDAKGRFVTPGIIDTHSHLGVYPQPEVRAQTDGNEASAAMAPFAAAEYAYYPQDPAIPRAQAGGVTTAQILPGSANMIGGRGVIVEMRTGDTVDDVRFLPAPAVLKMACGENPIRTHAQKGGPHTRMGEYAMVRERFEQARAYGNAQATYREERAAWLERRARAAELAEKARVTGEDGWVKAEAAPKPPERDDGLEVLAAVLRGELIVNVHCYRASDMNNMLAIADEFGIRIRSFHHALEAYKIRDELVRRDIAINTWADWWGFKMEALDGIPENAALYAEAGGRPAIHSDSAIGIQRLNQEAAKAMYAGRAAGIAVSEDEALRWITANPAWILGIDGVTGTLEAGKRADVVVWSGSPFSVYAHADQVFIAGELVYERAAGRKATDFELGNSAGAVTGGGK